jgi:hypothetical protein
MESIGWENNVLEIGFRDGSRKIFHDIPYEEYCGFLDRASPGASLLYIEEHYAHERAGYKSGGLK